MKSYNDLYTKLLSEYQSIQPNIQNPAFLKLQSFFKQINQQVDDETINGILKTLDSNPESDVQPQTISDKEEQNTSESPEENTIKPNVTPVMNNPLNPFNKNQQKTV
jgi:hypothetical protein